ncbi:MAG: hypothetical protein K6T72_14375 [Anoxybacillus sp.]|nr:hypothetical protein [Anoxybacillus sp.]MCL6587671.1 hypothetical protein [Anoxybacillus sp.]
MATLKVEISDSLMSLLDLECANTSLTKKQLVELILSAYFSDSSSRDVLFAFDILNKKIY